MSQRLPTVTAREVVAALLKAGFEKRNQTGSHLRLKNPTSGRTTVVPMHAGDLKRPLVKGIIKQAGLNEEEFRKLL